MSKKTIILERTINGRKHRAILTRKCYLHCDIIEALHNRLTRLRVVLDIDELFNQVIEKY